MTASSSPTPNSSQRSHTTTTSQHSAAATATASPRPSRLETLRARELSLKSTVAALTMQRNELVSKTLPSSTDTTRLMPQRHEAGNHQAQPQPTNPEIDLALAIAARKTRVRIEQLKQYNDIKDIGTQLMGMLAEKRGCRIVEVQREFGVDGGD